MARNKKRRRPFLRGLRVRLAELCYALSCALQYLGDRLLGLPGSTSWARDGYRHFDYALRGYDRWKDCWE